MLKTNKLTLLNDDLGYEDLSEEYCEEWEYLQEKRWMLDNYYRNLI